MPTGLWWLKMDANLPDHPKSLALERLLGEPRAWAYVAQLWFYATRFAPHGRFRNAAEVEAAARWEGKRGVLADALRTVHFLDRNGRAFVIHDWDQYQLVHIERRARDRAYQAAKRAERKAATCKPSQTSQDVTGNDAKAKEEARHDVGATSAPPSPSPSSSQTASGGKTISGEVTSQAPGGNGRPPQTEEEKRRARVFSFLRAEPQKLHVLADNLGRSWLDVEKDLRELKRRGFPVKRGEVGHPPVTGWWRTEDAT